MIVRPMTPADAEAAARLSTELGYPVPPAAMRVRIEHLASQREHGLFVACRDERVVGWVHVSAVHHLQSGPRAEIGGLIVEAESRGAGVGSLLVARSEQWAREQGLGTVLVRSQIGREAAHRFYERDGYTRTKTSAVFSKALTVLLLWVSALLARPA